MIGKKIAAFFFSMFLLSMAVFSAARLAPGDALISYYGDRAERMTAEERVGAEEKLGLRDSLLVQYVRWLENGLKGDFGISYKYKTGVLQVIGSRMENTLLLGGTGFLLIFLGALGLGSICALTENGWMDRWICRVGTISSCIPEFWMALVAILVFAVNLGWLPSSGAYDIGKSEDVPNRILHLILPLSVVVVQHVWYYAYMVRNQLLKELGAEYVLLAKSKGLRKGKILCRHCFPNMIPSYLSLMAISIPHILGGTYLVEAVFSYPGLGTLAYESARYHDYNLLMALCLLSGFVVILCNLAAQMINEKIDPRMKEQTYG